ncbi:MAG: FAD-binding domain-containing protein [Sphingorhabdus sp.]
MPWEPTRKAALARLAAFLPHAGRDYASGRNVDRGPLDRSNVSALSPYIRRRMITEEEVVRAVLAQHSFQAAEKFIQEVAWRTYWKGWLEMRPEMWTRYQTELAALVADLTYNSALIRRHQKAVEGRTGIDCFDVWVDELLTYGWLHNHTRMWFASIWIFTLGLPWQLGAAFFERHLLDADPASNTLSWRWVAGLHTRGKHYVARAENIEMNTLGRFNPESQLNERALPLSEDAPAPPAMMPQLDRTSLDKRVALILTEQDLHPESWALDTEVVAIAVLPTAKHADDNSPAAEFSRGALDDAADRAQAYFGLPVETIEVDQLSGWAKGHYVRQLVTAYPPVGAIAQQLTSAEKSLKQNGLELVRLTRDWDRKLWPLATAGFFKLKTKLPDIAQEYALG